MANQHGLTAIFLGAAVLFSVQGPFSAPSALAAETYKARLSVVPLDVAMQANIAGHGELTATLDGDKLTLNGMFEGLRSPATDAHIHRGPKGIPGPAILDVTVGKATEAAISGSVQLTSNEIDDLKNGRLYVQINSERAPDGNLRGWLLP
jgi:hypothetical protein